MHDLRGDTRQRLADGAGRVADLAGAVDHAVGDSTELVSTAKAGTPSGLSAEQIAAEDAAFEAALVELRAWYDEWSEIARLIIKRRDLLIRLGLAERRSPGSGGGVGGGGGGGGGGDPSPFITEPVTR
jgi:hypothetical protein